MPGHCKYLLENCELSLCQLNHAPMYEQLFDVLQELAANSFDETRWILQLSRTSTKLALKQTAIPAKSIANTAVRCSNNNNIPNLFHTLDCSLTFDEVIDWLGSSEKVINLMMFFEGIWTWMCANNNFDIECTTRLLQIFYKIKEKRQWEKFFSNWITYKRYGNKESKFFLKIKRDRTLCVPTYDSGKWISVTSSQNLENIYSLFEKETKLKFEYVPLNAGGCNKPGKCGFILKTVPAKDGANMILCTDPNEYSEEIHYHEEFKAKDFYFCVYPTTTDFCFIPLSWNGVPVIKSGKVYWGDLLTEYGQTKLLAHLFVQLTQ